MEPEFALRMEHGGSRRLRAPDSFNGAGVCTPDGTRPRHSLQTRTDASMEPEFALRMELDAGTHHAARKGLQWSRSLHSGWNP